MPFIVSNTSKKGRMNAGSTVSVGGRPLRVGESRVFESLPPEVQTLRKARLVTVREVAAPPVQVQRPAPIIRQTAAETTDSDDQSSSSRSSSSTSSSSTRSTGRKKKKSSGDSSEATTDGIDVD